jgi:hypothetical protein
VVGGRREPVYDSLRDVQRRVSRGAVVEGRCGLLSASGLVLSSEVILSKVATTPSSMSVWTVRSDTLFRGRCRLPLPASERRAASLSNNDVGTCSAGSGARPRDVAGTPGARPPTTP